MHLVHNTLTPDVETASSDYRKRFEGEVGLFFLETQRQAVSNALEKIGITRPCRILEVGGGHAQITEHLLQAGHRVTVHGSNESCFEYLRPLRDKHNGRLDFIVSSLWNFPLNPNEVDAAIGLRLLAHVEAWQNLVNEMARVSKRGVILDYASTSSLNILGPLLFKLKRKIEGNTRPYFSYSNAKLQPVLKLAGLESVYSAGQFYFPMGLHRGLKSARLSEVIETLARGVGLTAALGSPVMLGARKL